MESDQNQNLDQDKDLALPTSPETLGGLAVDGSQNKDKFKPKAIKYTPLHTHTDKLAGRSIVNVDGPSYQEKF